MFTDYEMQALLQRAQSGDAMARSQVLAGHGKLVLYEARRMVRPGAFMELEDLIQQGNLGLLRAIDKFEIGRWSEGRPVTFVTYAVYWIRHMMRRSIQNVGRTVAIPVSMQKDLQALHAGAVCQERMSGSRHRRMALAPWEGVSLEVLSDADLMERERRHSEESSQPSLVALLILLPERERLIIEALYGLAKNTAPKTIVQVARGLGISPQRVGQLRDAGLRKMRQSRKTDLVNMNL